MRNWLALFSLVGLAGFAYGVYYYLPQLSQTSPLLWLFVLDCPLFSLLMAIVFGLAFFGVKNDSLAFFASVGAFKYGVWTMFALLLYADWFFSPANALISAGLFAAHALLALGGLVLAGRPRVSNAFFAVVLAWFFVGDLLDYGFGLHPLLPPSPEITWVAAAAFALTFFTPPFFGLMSRLRRAPLRKIGFFRRVQDAVC
ncbi:MAG: DUF1405 domain-containing protein [Candidatus Micrarchaeota archaeon]